ncbi:type II secretion system protein GspI [Paraburkholderia dipogonis]|uniref:type II secretion system protein GspI n=1 Tax=Paraburkholderia dipogonis TaxID=1211383 RepID=UPI0035E566E1
MIEVLVALAIIAIALAASLRAVGSLASGEADLHRRLLAGWSAGQYVGAVASDACLAERRLDEFRTVRRGNLQLICTEQVTATPNPVFRRVEVMVTMPGGSGNLAQMVTVVANEKQPFALSARRRLGVRGRAWFSR